MSITTRLWNDTDLERLVTDDNLLTIFFNVKTYAEKEITRLYQLLEITRLYQLLGKRKKYLVYFESSDDHENPCESIYAASDESLIWFLKQEYDFDYVLDVYEVITTYREVTIQ
jgi:hypothetical protein